ncbi:dynein regulatory complex subunit 2-like isoform X2 [Cheilinus undulatus]|uniref:dynein regulatory complex subunit 2-like isoform X2 n=1 Tax=Cheilinus undulatus TaxID=241271 RepID=UPI001BD36400|nr:dynein regulatory complex subunit 2-like isoform X2 [Cheilinus undulatus]
MNKKDKNGAGKGEGRTEEDSMMLMQKRAQAEEEKARKKEEKQTQILKGHLEEYKKNMRVHIHQVNATWRQMLRQTQSSEMHDYILAVQNAFESEMEELDQIIERLERENVESQFLSAQNARVHRQVMERLWTLHKNQMLSLLRKWRTDMHRIRSLVNSYRGQILEDNEKQRAELEELSATLEKHSEDVMNELQRQCSNSKDSFQKLITKEEKGNDILKSMEHMEVPREEMEEQQESEKQSKKKAEKMEELTLGNKDCAMSQIKKEAKLMDSVANLQKKLKKVKAQQMSLEDVLPKKHLKSSTQKLRDQFNQSQQTHKNKITNLVVKADKASKKLKAAIAQGKKVVRAGEMAHKLESQVLPFLTPEEDVQEAETNEELPVLYNLQCHTNWAKMQRDAMRKNVKDLRKENRQIKLLLHQQQESMKVSTPQLDQRFALLTVTPATVTPPNTSRCHSEAAACAVKPSL